MFLALVSSKITFNCRKIGTRNFAAFSHLWCLFREVPQFKDLLYNTMVYIDSNDCCYHFFLVFYVRFWKMYVLNVEIKFWYIATSGTQIVKILFIYFFA